MDWTELSTEITFDEIDETPYPLTRWETVDTNNADFNLLKSILQKTSRCFDLSDSHTEADKLYYICPIILIACQIFGHRIFKINAERKVKAINLNGQFELVISFGKVRICIVEAKKHQIEQGKAQCFAGMMALTELDKIGSKPVYGIVTDYTDWVFSKSSTDNHCYYKEELLFGHHKVPTDESLLNILSHIYSLLIDAQSNHSATS